MKRLLGVLLAALSLLWPAAHALDRGGASIPDPFALIEFTAGTNRDTNALTLSAQTINTGVRNLIIIAAGQSNMANVGPTGYTPTNSTKVDQLNIYDGAIRNGVSPSVGTQAINNPPPGGANPALRLADDLVTVGLFDRVIVEPAAFTSSAVAIWETGVLSNRIAVAYRRLVARGIVCGSANIVCIVIWGQGESDCQLGTSQAAYTASLNNVIAASRAAGFTVTGVAGNGLWFVASQSLQAGSTCAAITAAQAAVVNHGAGVWAGVNADALTGNVCGAGGATACRQVDNTHLSDAGVYSDAGTSSGGWRAALHAFGAPF